MTPLAREVWVTGNGFSFNSFTVDAAVPLPSAALAGLAIMGLLAAGRFVRRHRTV